MEEQVKERQSSGSYQMNLLQLDIAGDFQCVNVLRRGPMVKMKKMITVDCNFVTTNVT